MLFAALAATACAAALPSSAPGRTAAEDVSVLVFLRSGFGIAKTTGPNFGIVAEVHSPVVQTVRVTVTLPAGLRWGSDAPNPSEGCTGDVPVVCTQPLRIVPSGAAQGNWFWDVVAEQPGLYEITSTVEPQEPDPDLSNNSHTFRFEVEEPPPPPPAKVIASSVKLAPAKPKAGAPVAATVRITAGGAPVRPNRVTCAGTAGGAKVGRTPRSASGTATCVYRPPRSAKGKTLRGTISFTAGGTKFFRRFSARLG